MSHQDPAALAPCPFCGGKAEIRDKRYDGTMASGMETPEPYARCVKGCVKMAPVSCDETPWGQAHGERTYKAARAEAVAAWNLRATDPAVLALTEERDRMRGLLEEARARRLHVPDCAVEYGGRCDCDEQKLSNRIDAALRGKETK